VPGVTPHATAPGDVYEFVIRGQDTSAGVQIVNVFHVLALTPACTANAIIQDFRTNLETEYKNMISSSVIFNRYLAFNLVPFQTDVAEQVINVSGGSVGTPHSTVVAGIITWRSARIGRRYRGRSYIGTLGNAQVTNSRLNGAMTTSALFLFATKMMARWGPTGTSLDMRLGIWSRMNGNQSPPHLAAGLTLVNNFTVQSAVGTMGTRRPGRGP